MIGKGKVFVAGATGATGTVFVPEATAAGLDLTLHVRPASKDKTPLGKDPRARIFDLNDEEALVAALEGASVVVSFVGTMRKRFGAGDTYASSDVGSAAQLAQGARRAGVQRFLLLSAVGAGGPGAYLKMKGECEALVRDSGLTWTMVRPSALETPAGAAVGAHGAREVPGVLRGAVDVLGHVPGLGGWAARYRPIGLDVVARAFVALARHEGLGAGFDNKVVEGRDLWALGAPVPTATTSA